MEIWDTALIGMFLGSFFCHCTSLSSLNVLCTLHLWSFYHSWVEWLLAFLIFFQTFVNMLSSDYRAQKEPSCFCFFFYNYCYGARDLYSFVRNSVLRSVWWIAFSPFKVYIYIVLFNRLWKKKYTLMNTLVYVVFIDLSYIYLDDR